VLPRTVRTGDVQVCHLHINPSFAEQDLNSVLPAERLDQLAELGEIGAAALSHYSYMGYTLRPERLLQESPPWVTLLNELTGLYAVAVIRRVFQPKIPRRRFDHPPTLLSLHSPN
jgi:hypothetical protein